jgi:hypothetical protein
MGPNKYNTYLAQVDKENTMKKTTQPKRFWCEDDSQTLKEIRTSKKNGKTIEKNGIIYEYVGEDMLFNTKTNILEKQ